jgi:hypothetical protein
LQKKNIWELYFNDLINVWKSFILGSKKVCKIKKEMDALISRTASNEELNGFEFYCASFT